MIRTCIITILCMALCSCASSPNGRMQLAAPNSVSAAYSEVNMKLSLITETNTAAACAESECELDRAFDQRVLRLGSGLAKSAFAIYPDLSKRFDKFEFVIAEKANPGSTSSAAGTIVIFRGVQKLRLGDEALSFLIAREMGHVIGHHHEENSTTRILFSVLATVFMPISNLISGSAALLQTASTSAAVTATTSAASYIGSKVTIASYKLDQLHEADAIALNLLGKAGWERNDIADALITSARVMDDDSWSKDLRASAEDAVKLVDAQNSITGLNVGNTGNGKTTITVGLAQPLADLPAGFTTDNPPRIVLDFPHTTNGLGKSVKNSYEEGMHSANIVQAGGRTRLVINLDQSLSYNTQIEGNSLLITLQNKDTDITVNNALRVAKADPAVR